MTASNTTSTTVQELRRALLSVRSYALQVWWATMVLGVLDETRRIPDGATVAVDGVAGIVRWMR